MNAQEMTIKWTVIAAILVVIMVFAGELLMALFTAAAAVPAIWVASKIFGATERGDFPRFVEDVFPEETEKIKERRRRRETGNRDHQE